MIYLLDTDTLSNLLKRTTSSSLLPRLATVPLTEQATSTITVRELIYGAMRVADRRDALLERIEQ